MENQVTRIIGCFSPAECKKRPLVVRTAASYVCVGHPRVRASCFRLSSCVRLYRVACTTIAYRETYSPSCTATRNTAFFLNCGGLPETSNPRLGRKTVNLGRLHLTQNAVFQSIGQHTLPVWVSGHLCMRVQQLQYAPCRCNA